MAESHIIEAFENIRRNSGGGAYLSRVVGFRELDILYQGVGDEDILFGLIRLFADYIADGLHRGCRGGDLILFIGEEGNHFILVEIGQGINRRVAENNRSKVRRETARNIQPRSLQKLAAGGETRSAVVVAGDNHHGSFELEADFGDNLVIEAYRLCV